MPIDQLCERVGHGDIVSGDPSTMVEYVASPDTAAPGSLIYCDRKGVMLEQTVKDSRASVIVIQESGYSSPDKCIVRAPDALHWFIKSLHHLMDLSVSPQISAIAQIAADAIIGRNVSIGPGTLIEEHCSIGDGTRIGANCYIGPGTQIGENCFIQNNNTIGSVGLGYHFPASGERVFYPHLGAVIIEPDVIVGSGCVIVRGQMSDTRIGRASRLANLINVAHNVAIGANTAISSNVCIAGGAKIGTGCNIAAGVVINAKIQIGDDSMIGLGSVVTKSVPQGKAFFGNPARPLPTMRKF
ncbi:MULTISPECIES: DapH/DapD/GlmU-related protein [unclassified Thiocapsa]|uniref:DapH/DapD/GlmU-related protein n=1 Tax=unclassified Thiocapsa TaxID=2641286 RepID=UPI0035B20192